MSERKHYVTLGADSEPMEITSWHVEGGWLQLIEDDGKNTVKRTLIPQTYPHPIGITTIYEDAEG